MANVKLVGLEWRLLKFEYTHFDEIGFRIEFDKMNEFVANGDDELAAIVGVVVDMMRADFIGVLGYVGEVNARFEFE